MSVLFGDFETRSACDLKLAGADVYARHPSTDILCLGYAFDDEPVNLWIPGMSAPARVLDHVRGGGIFKAHNASFEHLIWNFVGVRRYGWPVIRIEQLDCSMVRCYAMGLPGSLEKAAAAVGIEDGKDMAGNRVMRQISQPKKVFTDGSVEWWDPIDDMAKYYTTYEYCKKDIAVQRVVDRRVLNLSQTEKKVFALDQKINRRGMAVDLKAAKAALELVTYEKERMNEKIQRLTKNAVSSTAATGQFVSWLNDMGVVTESIAKADVISVLERDNIPPVVREALELRQMAAKSSTAKIAAMINGVCEDGRLRGLFQYGAAGTRRWAGRRVQLQNLPRNKLSQDDIDSVFKLLGDK